MSIEQPPELAFREALAARGFWRDAVLQDPELGFVMLDESGAILSINDNAASILANTTADSMVGRKVEEFLDPCIANERLSFVARVQREGRPLLVTSLFRGVRCRCVFRRLPGDAGHAGHILWTLRRAPIPWQSTDLPTIMEVTEASALDWGPLAPLTEDQRTIFRALASGTSLQETAARLELPLDTVLNAQHTITKCLGTDNPARWAQHAIAAGLLTPEPLRMGHS